MIILKFEAADTDNVKAAVRKAFQDTTWYGYKETDVDHTVSWGVRVDTLERQKGGGHQRKPLDTARMKKLLSGRNLTITDDGEDTLRCTYKEKAAHQPRGVASAEQSPKITYRRSRRGLQVA